MNRVCVCIKCCYEAFRLVQNKWVQCMFCVCLLCMIHWHACVYSCVCVLGTRALTNTRSQVIRIIRDGLLRFAIKSTIPFFFVPRVLIIFIQFILPIFGGGGGGGGNKKFFFQLFVFVRNNRICFFSV